jgi:hypothetical protein
LSLPVVAQQLLVSNTHRCALSDLYQTEVGSYLGKNPVLLPSDANFGVGNLFEII